MIEDIVVLGKANFPPSFFQDPRVKYALVIEFKTLNGKLNYEKISREEISENNLHRYMYREGPSNQYDFTPSSRLRTPTNTLNRITKWAKDNQHIIPGLYEALENSKNDIKKEIESKIEGEKRPSYLLTVKIDSKYLSDILPKDFLKNRIIQRCEKYENYSSSSYGKCAICGKEDKLYGLTLPTIGFTFYNVDKSGFAPQFSQKNSWKQVPLCKDCSLFLVAGKEFLDKYLKINSGLVFYRHPIYFYIIPSFLLKEERAVKNFIEKIKKIRRVKRDSLKDIRGLISKEDSIYDLVEKESDSVRLNLLFFIEKQSRFLILTYIQNLKPSWLHRLYDVQVNLMMREYVFSEQIMKKVFGSKKKGNFFQRIKRTDVSGYIKTRKGTYIPWWILFLRDVFPSQKESIEILSLILQKRKISYKFLLHKFNLFLQDSFKKQKNLSVNTLTTLSLYLFLNKLNLLKGDAMVEESEKLGRIFNYNIFSNNERKQAFLIGALANYVVKVQAKERNCKQWEAPFRQKFNNLMIDQNRLKKIFKDCVEKLVQYRKRIPSWLPKNLGKVLNTAEEWSSSIDEISYFFTLGLVLGSSLFKDKNQNNEVMKMENKIISNRSELLFLYDIKNANPNGDPDENKPRIDEETERNIVTDVRLKRTIRDYLAKYKGKDIWMIEKIKEDGTRKTREEKLEEANINNREDAKKLLEKFIDLRLFGATIAGKRGKGAKGEKVFTWIGPVQFKFGRSLHSVEPVLIRGTSVLPTKAQKAGGAFTEMWILPYSLICFYGIINENAARDTGLTEGDIKLLLEGMWNGTKNLITRSKAGQVPRFLLRLIYKENNYHIGDLNQKIKLLDEENKEIDKGGKSGKKIRCVSEVKVDISELFTTLENHKNKIKKIEYEVNPDVRFVIKGEEKKGEEIEDILKEIAENVERLGFR